MPVVLSGVYTLDWWATGRAHFCFCDMLYNLGVVQHAVSTFVFAIWYWLLSGNLYKPYQVICFCDLILFTGWNWAAHFWPQLVYTWVSILQVGKWAHFCFFLWSGSFYWLLSCHTSRISSSPHLGHTWEQTANSNNYAAVRVWLLLVCN